MNITGELDATIWSGVYHVGDTNQAWVECYHLWHSNQMTQAEVGQHDQTEKESQMPNNLSSVVQRLMFSNCSNRYKIVQPDT